MYEELYKRIDCENELLPFFCILSFLYKFHFIISFDVFHKLYCNNFDSCFKAFLQYGNFLTFFCNKISHKMQKNRKRWKIERKSEIFKNDINKGEIFFRLICKRVTLIQKSLKNKRCHENCIFMYILFGWKNSHYVFIAYRHDIITSLQMMWPVQIQPNEFWAIQQDSIWSHFSGYFALCDNKCTMLYSIISLFKTK